MARHRLTVSIDTRTLRRLDAAVRARTFTSRSQAIQAALDETLQRIAHRRLALECAKVNPAEERRLADEGLAADLKSWPRY